MILNIWFYFQWHLGFCSESYTPLKRGFDTYYGLFTGDEDVTQKHNYDQHRTPRKLSPKAKKELKLNKLKRRKLTGNPFKVKLNSKIYSKKAAEIIMSAGKSDPFFIYVALFTKSYPKQVRKTSTSGGIKDARNRDHAVKVAEMEESIANIVKALKQSGHYDNTVIFFISDNGGGLVPDGGRELNPNYPLRGSKGSMYEGGTKVPGFVHSPLFQGSGTRYSGIFHVTDILPTILHLGTGGQGFVPDKSLDGINQWDALLGKARPPRHQMVYNIDDNFAPAVLNAPDVEPKFQIAVRENNFKLIWGSTKMLHRYRFI